MLREWPVGSYYGAPGQLLVSFVLVYDDVTSEVHQVRYINNTAQPACLTTTPDGSTTPTRYDLPPNTSVINDIPPNQRPLANPDTSNVKMSWPCSIVAAGR